MQREVQHNNKQANKHKKPLNPETHCSLTYFAKVETTPDYPRLGQMHQQQVGKTALIQVLILIWKGMKFIRIN